MKKIALIGIAAVLAGVLIYWFAVRGRGESDAAPAVAKGSADPWDTPARPKGGGEPRAEPRPTGPMPKLSYEIDPDGTLLLEGQVLDEQDRPVAGAEVRISTSPARTTKSDTDGSFSFDKLLGRTYGVTARSGDLVGGSTARVVAKGEPVVIRMRQGAKLTVTVTDAESHKPIAGARVLRVDEGEDEVTTGRDGKAVLRGIDRGWVSVVATAEGYGPATASKGVGADRQLAIEVALSKGAALSGHVVDERGAGIAGARVWAHAVANTWEGGAGERLAVTTASDGGFKIPALASGSYTLHAKDEVHARTVSEPIQVDGESPTTGVRVVMMSAATIAGVVVDGEGAPVPYASVKAASTQWSPDMTYRQAAADDRGTFVIKGLPRVALKVRAEGEEASSHAVDVNLTAVAEKRDLKLTLDVVGTIAGIVVDESGEPVAEAEVSAFPDFLSGEVGDGDFVNASQGNATTDGGGRFVLRGLEKGKYRVRASRDGEGGRRRSVEGGVKAQTGDKDVRIELPAPGAIKGTLVVDGKGEAPELAMVSVDWEHRVTVRDGKFELGDLRPGKYDVRVSGTDFAERVKGDVEVVAGETTDAGEIVLRRGRTLSGRVTDKDGAPVPGARVMFGKMLFGDGKQTGSDDAETAAQFGLKIATTNASGEFTLRGTPRTTGSLMAEHATIGRSIAVRMPAGPDDLVGLELQLRGYGQIVGKVTKKGEPVGNATINVAPVGSAGQATWHQAGGDGSFAIDRVPEGQISLVAQLNQGFGSAGGSRTVTVVAGQKVDGSIELPSGPNSLTVKIEPRPGDTVPLAQAFLFRGTVAARAGDDIMDAFLTSGGVQAEEGRSTVSMGQTSAMIFWLGPAIGTFPTFKDLYPGAYSACVIPISGSMSDQTTINRIMRNLDKIDVVCKPVTVAATPALQETTMVVPAMRPLPAEEE